MKVPKLKNKKYATGGMVTEEEQKLWISQNHPDQLGSYEAMKTGQEKVDFYNALNSPKSVSKEQAALIASKIAKPQGDQGQINSQENSLATTKSINAGLGLAQAGLATAATLTPAATLAAAPVATGVGTAAVGSGLGITGAGAGLTTAGTGAGLASTAGIGTAGTAAGTTAGTAPAASGTALGAIATPIGIAAAAYLAGSTVGGAMKKQDEYGVNKSTLSESVGSTLHPQDDWLAKGGVFDNLKKGKVGDALISTVPFAAGAYRNEKNKKARNRIQDDYQRKVNAEMALAGAEQGSKVADYNMAEGGVIKGPGTGKSDSIKNKKIPAGSFVVPAENAPIAASLRSALLGKPTKAANLKSGGNIDVSNGEHLFTPEEALVLQQSGVNLNALAPNAELGNKLVNGGTPPEKETALAKRERQEKELIEYLSKPNKPLYSKVILENYLKKPEVRNYLRAISYLESDSEKVLTGGTKVDKNKDGVPDSTARGKYQFTEESAKGLYNQFGINVRKADHTEQDLGAIALLMEKKALGDVLSKNYTAANKKLYKIWPSLPGSGSNQAQGMKRNVQFEKHLAQGDSQIRAGEGDKINTIEEVVTKPWNYKTPPVTKTATAGAVTVPTTKKGSSSNNKQLELHKGYLKKNGATEEQIANYEDNFLNYWAGYSVNGTGTVQTRKEMLDLAIDDLNNKDDDGNRTLVKHVGNYRRTNEKMPYGDTVEGRNQTKVNVDAPLRDFSPDGIASPKVRGVEGSWGVPRPDMSGQRSKYGDEALQTEAITPMQPIDNTSSIVNSYKGPPPRLVDGVALNPTKAYDPNDVKIPTSNKINVMEALGGTNGLIALSQAGLGLAGTLSEKRPQDQVSPQFYEGKKDALIAENNAAQDALYGMSPEQMAQVKGEVNTNRASDYANIDASTGNTSAGFGQKRVASFNAGKNLVDLAVQNEQIKQQKKIYANSLKSRTDLFRNDIATSERNIFNDKLQGYKERQSASGALLNAGISNYLEGVNSANYNAKLKALKEKYPEDFK